MKKLFKNKIFIGIVGVLLLVGAITSLWLVYDSNKPQSTQTAVSDAGLDTEKSVPSSEDAPKFSKTVTINVKDNEGNTTKYTVNTDEVYLEGVMNQAEGLSFETTNGMVMTVKGIRADYVLDGAYWAFYIGSDYCNYGIADQPVADGDIFNIEYTKA